MYTPVLKLKLKQKHNLNLFSEHWRNAETYVVL